LTSGSGEATRISSGESALSSSIIDKTNQLAADTISNLANSERDNGSIKTSNKNGVIFVVWLIAIAVIMASVIYFIYRTEQGRVRVRRARSRAKIERYW